MQGARSAAISLDDFTLDNFYAGRLLDPGGSNPPTRLQAVVNLICSLHRFVGLTCPIPQGASLKDIRLKVVGLGGADVVSPSRLGGIRIRQGNLSQDVLVVVMWVASA